MADMDQSLLNDLVTESREHLESIEPALLELEEQGDQMSPELINEVFRAMHSIKGGFGFFGMMKISELSHKMESVLMKVRDGEMKIDSTMTDALLAGVDKLTALINNVEDSESMDIDVELEPLLNILDSDQQAAARSCDPSHPEIDCSAESIAMETLDKDMVLEALTPGSIAYLITIDGKTDIAEKNRTAEKVLDLFSELGTVVKTSENFIHCAQTGSLVSILFVTIMEPEHLAAFIELPAKQFKEIDLKALYGLKKDAPRAEEKTPAGDAPSKAAKPSAEKPLAPKDASQKSTVKQSSGKKKEGADSLRVRIELLNRLMNLAGELVLGRNQIKQALQAKVNATLGVNSSLKNFEMALASSCEHLQAMVGDDDNNSAIHEKLKKQIEAEFGQLQQSFTQSLAFSLLDTPGLAGIMQNIDLVTSELQNDIMNTRMQPVGAIFSKFSRVIRDISKKLGKQIDLLIEGEDVELDKSIIELLGDPLTHLVRNSADHGIELPDVREAAGKDPLGRIHLKAYHEGGVVNIDVIDDGAGLDVEKIRAKAIEKKQTTEDELARMTNREILSLIFAPGLSTAEEVTDVSGRGVGMDVVKTNIEKLGGTIDIDSALGRGTKINLKLPLTLAIIPSLLVTVEDRLFAVPQVSIEELVRVHANEVNERIENVQGKPVLRLREKLLPLVHLNDVLGLPRTYKDSFGERHPDRRANILDRRKETREFSAGDLEPEWPNEEAGPTEDRDEKKIMAAHGEEPEMEHRRHLAVRRSNYRNALHILVLKVGINRYGLIVDRLLDHEEIVVKPLSTYFKNCKFYSGSTIMGDGRVAMILDALGIAETAGLRFGGRLDAESEAMAGRYRSDALKEVQSLLLFHNGTDERFVINLAMIARVEKVTRSRLEVIGEDWYLKYDEGSLRIFHLHDYLPVKSPEQFPEQFFVIVPKLIQSPMGIIAHKIEDIIQTKAEIDCNGVHGSGILGSIMHEKHMLILLDLYSLFEAVDPDRKRERSSATNLSGRKVLLAEDTAFFRSVESEYLQSLGCVVDTANDGQEAWQMLNDAKYDMLVTDIEMPNVDGVELTKRVRSSNNLSDLPVVALTSLMMEKDKKRIIDSGADAYEAKLDKQHLYQTMVDLFEKA